MKHKSYLLDDRDSLMPVPTIKLNWLRVTNSNVTSETIQMLHKLQDTCSDVSVFSWHPNIKYSQYSAEFHRGFETNYNTRISMACSIYAKTYPMNSGERNAYRGSDILRNSINHIRELESLGGNGNTENESAVTRLQVSFLKTVDTFEESDELKNRIFTHGAYMCRKNEWFYIPANDFNPYREVIEKIEKRKDELEKILSCHPAIKKIQVQDRINSRMQISEKVFYWNFYIETDASYSINIKEDCYDVKCGIFTTVCDDLKCLLELIGKITDYQIQRLVKSPSDCKEILHEYRGKVASKRFGF